MERHHQQMFQGLINPTHLFGEYLDVESLEQFVNTEKLRFEEEEEKQGEEINFSISTTTPTLEDKIPFLQMLQSAESPTPTRPFSPLTQGSTSFQTLLKFQHNNSRKKQQQQPWESNYYYNNNNNIINMQAAELMERQIQPLEHESCITHDMFETKLDMGNLQNPHSGVSSECNREQTNSIDNNGNNSGSSPACSVQLLQPQQQLLMRPRQKAPAITRERRKRKRTTRASKNKEEVENQRMTHIAVERNRRRQMNDHLSSLRSLMPPSYVQRGDQASIIGGAIDFVKELEQLLQSLQAQKKLRKSDELSNNNNNNNPSSPSAGLNPLTPAQVTGTPSNDGYSTDGGRSGEHRAENKSEAADIEVTVIQTHVNLKIQCGRRPGQLLKVIVALEDLRLTVLHLNITSFESSVIYSFNLKIEDECKIGSADGIAGSVHQIFNYINGT